AEPWAAIFDTAPGRVTLRFSAPLRAIGLTPDGARRLAAKLLLLAETADRECGCAETYPQLRPDATSHGPGCPRSGTFSAPAEGLEACPVVDLHREPAS
ncbi:MAG TPA: hypothetical protein VF989_07735, partial [Polyangiaceae bacterium]